MAVLFQHITDNYYIHHKRDNQPNNDDFPHHVHNTHEFCYFISGSGKFSVESSSYDLYPGCIMIIRAGEAHRLRINTDLPYERIDIEFSPDLFSGIDPDNHLMEAFSNRPAGHRNLYSPEALNSELIRSCMNALSAQFQTVPNKQKQLVMLSCMSPVLLEIHRAYLSYNSNNSLQSEKTVSVASQLVEYINAHLCESFTLDSLAQEFFTSKTHLNNQFRKVTGFTIWEYTVTKRLVLARQYIRDGMPVGVAAISSGWNDYSSFYRSYKARFGVSPISDRSNKTMMFNPAYDIEHH